MNRKLFLDKLLLTILILASILCLGLAIALAYVNFSYATNELELVKMHATAYCLHGTTATGTETRHGIAAGRKDLLGKTAVVYQRLPGDHIGQIIGIYEIQDTGGTEGLNNGTVIDIWCEDLDECQEFMNTVYEDGCKGKVYVQFIDAEG